MDLRSLSLIKQFRTEMRFALFLELLPRHPGNGPAKRSNKKS